MANGPNDFDNFVKKLDGYEQARKEEFEVALNCDNIDEVRKLIDKKIAQALPGFVDQLIMIAEMGDTDTAKLNAVKFAFNWYFKESSHDSDPFTAMLDKLTAEEEKQ